MGSRIRSTLAWALLLAILLPAVPIFWIGHLLTGPFDRRRDGFRKATSAWISLYAILTPLYRFRLEGTANLPRRGPYVLVANHESGLDVLSLLRLRTPSRFLVNASLFRIPLARWFFGLARHIPLELGNAESGRRALERAGRALAEGTPVAVFPEGELLPEGMGAFRPGAFVAAKRAGVAIVPVLLEGAGSVWAPGSFTVQGVHEIRVAVLPPVGVDHVAKLSVEELSARVRSLLLAARRYTGERDRANAPQGQPDL